MGDRQCGVLALRSAALAHLFVHQHLLLQLLHPARLRQGRLAAPCYLKVGAVCLLQLLPEITNNALVDGARLLLVLDQRLRRQHARLLLDVSLDQLASHLVELGAQSVNFPHHVLHTLRLLLQRLCLAQLLPRLRCLRPSLDQRIPAVRQLLLTRVRPRQGPPMCLPHLPQLLVQKVPSPSRSGCLLSGRLRRTYLRFDAVRKLVPHSLSLQHLPPQRRPPPLQLR
mmetsp:Transcript_22665/g.50407  ORF Transcript_22665/g.50407 Transcript_22665/m.50407 type:complete len:226 (-) Transcript_22665:780-1457(-)